MGDNCGNCRFYSELWPTTREERKNLFFGTRTHYDEGVGLCRRRAPRKGGAGGEYPTTPVSQWCGEYEGETQ